MVYKNIHIAAHIILGLPEENFDNMLHTIKELNTLDVDGVKIHHIQVVKHTLLADWYAEGSVFVFTAEGYIQLLVELLPQLSQKICVHRLVGETKDDLLIAPRWQISKTQIIQKVEEQLRQEEKHQGSSVI